MQQCLLVLGACLWNKHMGWSCWSCARVIVTSATSRKNKSPVTLLALACTIVWAGLFQSESTLVSKPTGLLSSVAATAVGASGYARLLSAA